jgi:hypothetical protein
MESPTKEPPSAAITTAKSGAPLFSNGPKKSPRKRKAAALRPQPTLSDSDLSPLSETEPVIAREPAKKKRKVAPKAEAVENEEYIQECIATADDTADPVNRKKGKRKVKPAMTEEDISGCMQEDEAPKKRKRRPRAIGPVAYDIPAVERKEATFKGELRP